MKTSFRVLLLTSVVCVLASYVSASTVMVGEARPPTNPANVKVYMEPPSRFDRIAIIRKGSGAWAFADQTQVDEAIAKIRVEAAKVGANGILLQVVETNSSGGLGIGVGGLGIGGGPYHHHGWHGGTSVGVGGSFYAPILHKTVQAEAIYVRKK
ncbi:MAG: hypothetical protein QOE73_2280 [Verrucomicrobiota bacterium]